jgi:hypothetical protein
MNKRLIDRFLATLAAELNVPARAFLTGAAAGALWGRVRPSLDIDLGLELRGTAGRSWEATVEPAVQRTTRLTGVPASVAEDIDHWGMITLLEYKRTSKLYRRFDLLEVRLLDPVHWAIGKLTRALEPDLRDVLEVFRKQEVPVARTANTWGRALRASPPSTSQSQFRRHVESFFRTEGRRIWGRRFDAEAAIRRFERAARIAPPAG